MSKGKVYGGSGTVTFTGEGEPNFLANMFVALLGGVMGNPKKKHMAEKMCVSVAIEDINAPENAITFTFKGSDVTVANGVNSTADVYVGTPLANLMELAGPGSVKDKLKKVVKMKKAKQLKTKGILKNASQMSILKALLTMAPAS
ncbi:MAG: hypothetical protein ACYC55_06575 [Candidatus Geothermincolia bacterium]